MSNMKTENSTNRLKTDRSWALLIVALTLPTLVTFLYFNVLSDKSDSVQKTAMSVGKAVQFGLPLIWVIYVRKYWPRWKTGFDGSMLMTGLVSGLVIFAAAMAVYHGWLKHTDVLQAASQEVIQRVDEMGFNRPAAFIGLGCFYVLMHSLLEEYYWRWFVFGMLKDFTSNVAAMWISSIGFMAHHVLVLATYFGWQGLGTYFFSACVAIGGLLWSWMYNRTGKLWGPWLSHALVDAVIFVIGYDMLF